LSKPVSRALLVIIGIVAGVVIAGIIYTAMGYSIFSGEKEPETPDKNENAQLIELAYSIVESIRDGDYAALSEAAPPEFGVVFSPYATIVLKPNQCFFAEQIAAFETDTSLYMWGKYIDSGEPIDMTVADYFAEFVFDRDYSAAPIIGVNHIIRRGNALENIKEVFPNAIFVEFHIPGCEKDGAEEFDWSTLRLGFEEYEGGLKLTLILHSEGAV